MSKNLREKELYSKFQGDEYYGNLVKRGGLLYRDKNPINFLLQKFDYKGPAIVAFILGAVVSSAVFLNKLPDSEDQIALMLRCLMIPVLSYFAGFIGTLGYIAYLAGLEKNVLDPSIKEVSNDMKLRLNLSNSLDKWASILEKEKLLIGNEGCSCIYRVSDLVASIQNTSAKLKNTEVTDVEEEVKKVLSGFDTYASYFNQIRYINGQNVKVFDGL